MATHMWLLQIIHSICELCECVVIIDARQLGEDTAHVYGRVHMF